MRAIIAWCVSVLLASPAIAAVSDQQFNKLQQTVTSLSRQLKALNDAKDIQKDTMTALARQVSQQQLYVEEMTRSHGDSGLKLTRLTRTGSKPYFATTFVDQKVAAIHDHSNYIGTVGMGELVAVLNGVEFRTRHNDYKMQMPSKTSLDYGKTELVPYPKVPPQVLAKPTLQAQIEEMREWFKAWQNSDYTRRDYRKYFTANLCYLEGQWTVANGDKIDEPFASSRHAIDAKNFFDLQSKIHYTSTTGRKSLKENYAYLPTTIANVDDNGNVIYSQWNYQILCHPLKRHVPLTRFRMEEDIGPRVANGKRQAQMFNERSARFSLYEDLRDTASPSTREAYIRDSEGTFLDLLMSEIPGKDNYKADIVDSAFGQTAYNIDANLTYNMKTKPSPLNVGFYHNAYKVDRADAMGTSISRRGFSDASLYVAYNTRTKVTPVSVEGKCVTNHKCSTAMDRAGSCLRRTCPTYTHRVSYAIPLEIIYTTPLQTWNPYKLAYFDKDTKKPAQEKMVNKLSRNGGLTKERAFYGTSHAHYYWTPSEFYEKSTLGGKTDAADTVRRNDIGVLDPAGNVKRVVPSGISISTKEIPGVGKLRIRYPVMPIHDYGNVVYKHLSALTDMTLKKHKYEKLYPDSNENGTVEEIFVFETKMSDKMPPDVHLHTFEMTLSEIELVKTGKIATVVTSTNGGHNHELQIYYNKKWNILGTAGCDKQRWKPCFDGHYGRVWCPDCKAGYPVN